MYSNLPLFITLLAVVNYGNCDEFGELLAKQLIGRVKEPFAYGSRSRIVTEVIGWTQTVAESTNRLSYDVTMRVCEKNGIQPSAPGVEMENHCQTCESTVTIQKAPFKILEEMDNGCDDGSSDNSDKELRNSFEEFMKKYDKMYENEDVKERRFRIFQENVATMERLQKTEMGTAKYGTTKFSDLTDEEFRRFHTGYRGDFDYHHQPMDYYTFDNEPLPNGIDWREKDVVSPVKDQGQCNSCWSFATTGVLESQYAIKNKKQILLSEQELVDCDRIDHGCNGGRMQNAYAVIKSELGGLEQETDYPYHFRREICRLSPKKFVVSVSNYTDIPPNEDAIAKYLAQFGPIAAAVNSTLLKYYVSGIIDNYCGHGIDHAILIVGYGEGRNPRNNQILPHWVVKNSWSARWGENGYFRLYRGNNLCGIANDPSIAFI